MGIKCMVSIAAIIVLAAGSVESQQSVYPVPNPQAAPFPQEVGPQGSPYADPPTGYQPTGPPVGGYQDQQPANQLSSSQGQWPTYPYPQYHNPYYQGADPRAALNGTIDWLFSLPSVLMDKVSNVVDKNFFPLQPATSGGTTVSPTGTPQVHRHEQKPPGLPPQTGTHEPSAR